MRDWVGLFGVGLYAKWRHDAYDCMGMPALLFLSIGAGDRIKKCSVSIS